MSLQHHDNGEQGEFFLLDEQGKKIAKLTYFYETPDTICTQLVAILQENGNEPNLLNHKLNPINKRFIFKDIFPASCYP